jgi:SAM-dependent methyltransferase
MEEPALMAELGSVAGLRVLDLGCGDAAIGRALLEAGCASYVGIDGSKRMVGAARASLAGSAGEVLQADIEDFRAEPGGFDLVVSRMALHYVEDLSPVMRACRDALTPGGRLIFTVTHPLITSHDPRATGSEPRQSWVVDDYFVTGPRRVRWFGTHTTWHHRTIEDYVRELREAGFALRNLRECPPDRARFEIRDEAEYKRRLRIPLILLLAAER